MQLLLKYSLSTEPGNTPVTLPVFGCVIAISKEVKHLPNGCTQGPYQVSSQPITKVKVTFWNGTEILSRGSRMGMGEKKVGWGQGRQQLMGTFIRFSNKRLGNCHLLHFVTSLNCSRMHKLDSSQIQPSQKRCSGKASHMLETTKLCLIYGNRLQLIQRQTSCRHSHALWIHSCLLTQTQPMLTNNHTSETDAKKIRHESITFLLVASSHFSFLNWFIQV